MLRLGLLSGVSSPVLQQWSTNERWFKDQKEYIEAISIRRSGTQVKIVDTIGDDGGLRVFDDMAVV